jgi:hypothetical protein
MDIEAQRAKVKKWSSIALVGVVGLLVSPVIFLAIQGLIGLIIAGVVGLAVVTFTPYMTMKFANWKVKAIMAEASANPIETMINLLAAKKAAFLVFKTNVENSAAARDTFKQKCEKFAAKYPARAAEFQGQLERMVDLVQRKKLALRDAQKSLEDGENKLEEMQAYWEMSKDAIELNKAAGMDTGDAFEKLKADTACDAVFESMNRAFAQLEVADALEVDASDKPAQTVVQLSHSEPVVLNVPVRETQKVSR